ncbi:ABC transporter ATP-binding protein [Corynebacterium diphtheriae]|uniref:ABC transporter ATP-binding protein n=1 Tax=Corynebacterium diphtheriae TaxID=1717 RepID=A0A811G521_CORDP|nr:ABC transporter ATP-binding protein [Corynebacterium diphtheriae]AWR15129.1 ABC transporter ATP-binding protein [Corynebacterium diphtheriae]MBG9222461.1 ABC transporter ATP-binding protein [Corynebacterium diphtheriae bv. mitis]MBG9269556.1 ABC transporter ATP-binding protein [Corynebacterium diphtheriae bv. gravis]MBG9301929.1 ABC transporter ATP-binding protein [Corynebacterium diphtheriae bv. mitis]OFI51899.1 ABC transporter ATP-binding protein [Corynebacterium diphtheriae]
MTALITATGVKKSFGKGSQKVTVLKGIDLTILPGESVAIVGKSGSGKSTLLYCLSGLLAPDEGSIYLANQNITATSPRKVAEIRRNHASFIFQDLNLISSLTVADNIRLPSKLAGRNPKKREIDSVLEKVGLSGAGNKYPNQLSGGQQQRVAIARSLVRSPQILFADEPTGALDVTTSALILKLLQETVTKRTSLVMVTHDLDIAASADRVVVLKEGNTGQILHHTTPTNIFDAMHKS